MTTLGFNGSVRDEYLQRSSHPELPAPELSYDYMLVRGACGGTGGISPVILDTDGAVRWISPFLSESILTASATFFDHAVYVTPEVPCIESTLTAQLSLSPTT